MPKYTLPAYAIVELLIRLSHHYKQIGDYKNHKVYEDHALVKTTGGTICFPAELVMQQFNDPALVSHEALAEAVASSFKPLRISAKTI
jgi:hypothetical protein